MPSFMHGEVEIAYFDEGQSSSQPPVVLVHGFASNKEVNWIYPGWVTELTRSGRRVIALDNRGHGKSAKLYDPAAYHTTIMAEDLRALLDHLSIERADCMGYSMGARICAFFALKHAQRARSIVLGGLGLHLIDGVGLPETIADALLSPSRDSVTDSTGRQFRMFAEQTRSDLKALAACIRGSRQVMAREDATVIEAPALIAVGTNDTVAGSPHLLADIMRNARALDIPGRDHMLAVGDKVFKAGVLHFLDNLP